MSDPTAERLLRERPPAALREGVGGALGILLGLVLIFAGAWFALRPAARPLDARAALAGAFVLHELPFELLPEGAAEHAGGERIVSFGSARAGLVAARPEPRPELHPEDDEEIADASSEGSRVDWGALTPTATAGPPARVVLVRFPPGEADAQRRRHFNNLRFRSFEDLGRQGGRAPLERQAIGWHGLDARSVRERHFRLEAGAPSFVDSVRVDLTLPGEPWMLVAIWPPLEAASLEPVASILEALQPAR